MEAKNHFNVTTTGGLKMIYLIGVLVYLPLVACVTAIGYEAYSNLR